MLFRVTSVYAAFNFTSRRTHFYYHGFLGIGVFIRMYFLVRRTIKFLVPRYEVSIWHNEKLATTGLPGQDDEIIYLLMKHKNYESDSSVTNFQFDTLKYWVKQPQRANTSVAAVVVLVIIDASVKKIQDLWAKSAMHKINMLLMTNVDPFYPPRQCKSCLQWIFRSTLGPVHPVSLLYRLRLPASP